ncbi:hypothetical protein AB1Y20_021984 [Prymnesium parvum]|uniref:Uncharacterized protein n=1 Tax=Prymnesium parvum TaxID=97485 RepID=A0AB34JFW0_PRYPA
MFYLELLVTIGLAYAVSEAWRPAGRRWELLRALCSCSCASVHGVAMAAGSLGTLLLLCLAGFVELPPMEGASAREAEGQRRARRAGALIMLAFIALAYADVRARVGADSRVSWLWFLRAAAAAALKTCFLYGPLVALLVALPAALLLVVLQARGHDVRLLVAPVEFCLSYGPYVACYWVIKRDFARSPAAQLPILPLAAGEGAGGGGGWCDAFRRDLEMDAMLRGSSPAKRRGALWHVCKWVVAVWCLMMLYVCIALTVVVFDEDDEGVVISVRDGEEGEVVESLLVAFPQE